MHTGTKLLTLFPVAVLPSGQQLHKRKKLGKLNGEKRPDKYSRAVLDKRLGHYTHAHEGMMRASVFAPRCDRLIWRF